MIDLFIEPVKFFLNKGIDAFKDSKEQKNLSASVRDRLRRECKFNSTVLLEVSKLAQSKSEEINSPLQLALIQSLNSQAYEDVNEGGIPLALLFDGQLSKGEWPVIGDAKRFHEYTRNDSSLLDLLDRTFYRLSLTKTFAGCGQIYGQIDYLRFLVAATEYELRRD